MLLNSVVELSQEAYEDLRWELIFAVEAREADQIDYSPYFDNANPQQITIGVGFNIQGNVGLREPVFLQGLNLDPNIDDDYISDLNEALDNGNLAELDAIMERRYEADQALADDDPTKRFLTVDSFDILAAHNNNTTAADQAVRNIFNFSAEDIYEDKVDRFLSDYAGATLVTSEERVALFSLAYNQVEGGTALLGPTLGQAINDGNRPAAWFEIAYRSNTGRPGNTDHAQRRYVEASIFGLYGNPESVSDLEAKEVLDFFLSSETFTYGGNRTGTRREIINWYHEDVNPGQAALNDDEKFGGLSDYIVPF